MKNYKLVLLTIAALFVFSAFAMPANVHAGEYDWSDWSYSEGPVGGDNWSDWNYSEGPVDSGDNWSDWSYSEGDCCGYEGDCCEDPYYEPEYCGCDIDNDGYVEYEEYQEYYGGGSGGGQPSFRMPSFGGYSYSQPRSYSYPTTPVTFHAPSYTPPTTITNTSNNCVNNSCNNTVTNINNNNSINGSIVSGHDTTIATVYPIQQAPVHHPVQYVQPVIHPAPFCTITITNYNQNTYGTYGNQLATLTWSSGNATYGYITPNIGTVSGYGTMQVYPTSGQTYTMTVYGAGGTATCSTVPFYAPVVTYQNPTPYVSLSQIPYTGLELGTLGNVIYWLSMVTFAGAAAYLVLYFNGGVLALFTGRRSESQVVMPKITVSRPILAPVAAVAETPAPVLSPIQLAKESNRYSTQDSMKVHAGANQTPRIVISRE